MKEIDLVLLTPFSGSFQDLLGSLSNTYDQLEHNDLWLMILDNQGESTERELREQLRQYNKIILLHYRGVKGAGFARNYGLDFLHKKKFQHFLLLPLDADDELADGSIQYIKSIFKDKNLSMATFGMVKVWPSGKTEMFAYTGSRSFGDLLRHYVMPCGSTVIRVSDPEIFLNCRFGSRKRANDLLFFMSCLDNFGSVRCFERVVLHYSVGGAPSLSSKKYKMPLYRYLAYRDMGLSRTHGMYYLVIYVVRNLLRLTSKFRS